MSNVKPPRGRPQLVSTADLQARAIAIVSKHGFEQVTMSVVASEIGVSLRTLHRHFPSKNDLVWGVLDDTFARLREHLAQASPESSIFAAIESAITASFSVLIDDDSHRERLRLIAVSPELQATQSEALQQWRTDIAEFVAGRLHIPASELIPNTIAAAAQSATFAALTWWATHEDSDSAVEVVGRALRALDPQGA